MRRDIRFLRGSSPRVGRRLRRLIPREWKNVVIGRADVFDGFEGGFVKSRPAWIVQLDYEGCGYTLDLGLYCPVHRLQPIVAAWSDIRCDGMAEAAGWFIGLKLCERSVSDMFFTARCLDPKVEAARQAKEAARIKKANETRERIAQEQAALDARVRDNSRALLTGQPYKLSESAILTRNALRSCLPTARA